MRGPTLSASRSSCVPFLSGFGLGLGSDDRIPNPPTPEEKTPHLLEALGVKFGLVLRSVLGSIMDVYSPSHPMETL